MKNGEMMGRKFKSQFDKRPVKDGHYPCDDLLPGDGVDPRHERQERKDVPNRKALQLCAQVKDVLNLVFPGMEEGILRELYVASVVPAPDSTQLLITVSYLNEVDELDAAHYLKLNAGKLRSEVAFGINRKRVPQLKFIVKKGA